MSTYKLCFQNIALNSADGACATIEISGNQFPQPNNSSLTLSEGILTGSFASAEGAPLVDSFTFSLPEEQELSVVQISFNDYPEDYTEIPLTATFGFNVEASSLELGGISSAMVDEGGDKKRSIQIVYRRRVVAMEDEELSIQSFDLTTLEFNGVEHNAGRVTMVESSTPTLTASLNKTIDFNSLSESFLIYWKKEENPTVHVSGSVSIADNA